MTPASLTLRAASSALQKTGAHKSEDVPTDIQPGDDKIYIAENNPSLKKLIYYSDQWFKLRPGFDEPKGSVPADWKFSVADAKKVKRLVVPHLISHWYASYRNGEEIGDTSDLKYFTHLKSLDFNVFSVKDPAQFIKSLPVSLEELKFTPCSNGATDSSWVEALSRLKNLRELDLSNAGITDIRGLEKLTKLEKLNLSKNYLTDITPLKGLKELQSLDISENNIQNIAALNNLTKLKNVDLSHNQIRSLAPLGSLSLLENCNASFNRVRDIGALSQAKQLKTLTIAYNQVSNVDALKSLTSLESLNMRGNKISDVSALQSLGKLKSLDIAENKVYDISKLSSLKALKSLDITQNKISDVSCLALLCKHDGLTTIKGDWNNISDVSSILQEIKKNFPEHSNYSYVFEYQSISFDKVTTKRDLPTFDVKGGGAGVDFYKSDKVYSSIELDPYTCQKTIYFKAKDSFDKSYDPHNQLLFPHVLSFKRKLTLQGSVTFYRYKPQLTITEPLQLDFGHDYPDDFFVSYISIENEKQLPLDARIRKYIRGAYKVSTFSPGENEQRIDVSFDKKDKSSGQYTEMSNEDVSVPVYVKTMAETWKPSIAPLTLKAGETLTLQALKKAITDTTLFNKYVPTREELDNGTYRQEDENIKLYSKWKQDGDFAEYVCAPPEFDWGNFKDREVLAREAGTTISVPFTMTLSLIHI